MTHETEPAHDEPVVEVTVVRTGGFAGITRRWGVTAPPQAAAHWIELVDDCPWDACAPGRRGAPDGADRFSWSVRATLPGARRRAELTESEASGPWRTLIDAVREASAPSDR